MGYTSYKGRVLTGVGQAVAKGIGQFAFDVVAIANTKAPRDTGQLRQSGKVIPKEPLVFAVQFSRSSKDGYNVAERMEFDETLKHPKGGQAKYLSSTIETLRPQMGQYIKRYM